MNFAMHATIYVGVVRSCQINKRLELSRALTQCANGTQLNEPTQVLVAVEMSAE